MIWIFPWIVALMYGAIALLWFLMWGRWKAADFQEIGLGTLLTLVASYGILFCIACLSYFRLSVPPLGVALTCAIYAILHVILLGRIRKWFDSRRDEGSHDS